MFPTFQEFARVRLGMKRLNGDDGKKIIVNGGMWDCFDI
jgi:hypothetical protein